jgi:hypothetical protein
MPAGYDHETQTSNFVVHENVNVDSFTKKKWFKSSKPGRYSLIPS